jgi:hypothetical protein
MWKVHVEIHVHYVVVTVPVFTEITIALFYGYLSYLILLKSAENFRIYVHSFIYALM